MGNLHFLTTVDSAAAVGRKETPVCLVAVDTVNIAGKAAVGKSAAADKAAVGRFVVVDKLAVGTVVADKVAVVAAKSSQG